MSSNKQIYDELERLLTEQRNRASSDIDVMDTLGILRVINNEDKLVAHAVEKQLSAIAEAVELAVQVITSGGRLIYVGAGTSGRLGILDAAECPPTFGTPPGVITGIIAGGKEAVFKSQEGAEDNVSAADVDLSSISLTRNDLVCGLAASSRTPYVIRALEYARTIGAKTVFVTTNHGIRSGIADVVIDPDVGPEVIMGSTRMKSGTAQKLVLNMITTASMIRLGKVYENMMVDLQLTNQKLRERAKRIIMMATGVDYDGATHVLDASHGYVKTAIVMLTNRTGYEEAQSQLKVAGGFVRAAIDARR